MRLEAKTETRTVVRQAERTYLVVGHVTKDVAPEGDFVAGGTATYAGFMAKQLGWHPVIVTAAAADFHPPTCLADAEWHIRPSPHTTTFRNLYGHGGRRQKVGPVARPIRPDDIPPHCLGAALVHLGPVAQEVDPQLAGVFETNSVVVTPQGWMRGWDEQGNVFRIAWQGTELLDKFRAVVISIEDIAGDWSLAERLSRLATVLVVTEGARGCTVFSDGRHRRVPVQPARVVDPTGAGDVFAAAFFIRYYESKDVFESARFANVAASLSIQRPGIQAAPTRRQVEDSL